MAVLAGAVGRRCRDVDHLLSEDINVNGISIGFPTISPREDVGARQHGDGGSGERSYPRGGRHGPAVQKTRMRRLPPTSSSDCGTLDGGVPLAGGLLPIRSDVQNPPGERSRVAAGWRAPLDPPGIAEGAASGCAASGRGDRAEGPWVLDSGGRSGGQGRDRNLRAHGHYNPWASLGALEGEGGPGDHVEHALLGPNVNEQRGEGRHGENGEEVLAPDGHAAHRAL